MSGIYRRARHRGLLAWTFALLPALATAGGFRVEEASIADIQQAIRDGATSCHDVVQAYVDRARAYNGMCTRLVTADGQPVEAAPGTVRAGLPLQFPTRTVAVGQVLPDFSQYKGLPIEYGRLQATVSDPSVVQQYGMVVGIAHARQVNALSTLNLRGERSVTCKGAFDAAPGTPLPADAPPACEAFRQQPDALEAAAALDAKYGRHPDLQQMPMYCVPFSFKDVFDTRDMRSTGGADVAYAMDAPPEDATIVAELRAKGAIIYAKANLAEYNAGAGNPGGEAKVRSAQYGAGARSTWGGPSCNPYDTARETGGSSSGSAASVGANLVVCSICEETGGSCRQPAWRNGVVGFVTTKGLMPYGGAIGADPYLDRAGIQCRSVRDAALVLDALKDPERGYFDPRDLYTALPPGLISKTPYASYAAADPAPGGRPLAGLRIGVVREYMVRHSANDVAMSDLVDAQIKTVLRDRLGAELLESRDPLYPDDPGIADLRYGFAQALAEILPLHMPEFLQKKDKDGHYLFDVPGYDIGKRDYMVAAGEGKAPLSDKLNLRSINVGPPARAFGFDLYRYLMRRGDAKVRDWASLNANASYYVEARTVAMKNWEKAVDILSEGATQNVKMREVMRMVVLKVMQQNRLDVLVNPTTTIPPALIGYASQPQLNDRPVGRFPTSANLGIPEITVPAGFNRVVYEPRYALNDAKDKYEARANETQKTQMEMPMPIGISFWAGPGEEPAVLKVAAAYEAATRHRRAPAEFGPVPAER
ncbi:amidase family protein [Solimonas flava]|uniref:amidase family protein n=1 Tax=Solimonas flava TaxID=415849 RepID=UPI00040721F4|nr:amidase [Solimonas flava]